MIHYRKVSKKGKVRAMFDVLSADDPPATCSII